VLARSKTDPHLLGGFLIEFPGRWDIETIDDFCRQVLPIGTKAQRGYFEEPAAAA
jgi:hypothetical protein